MRSKNYLQRHLITQGVFLFVKGLRVGYNFQKLIKLASRKYGKL